MEKIFQMLNLLLLIELNIIKTMDLNKIDKELRKIIKMFTPLRIEDEEEMTYLKNFLHSKLNEAYEKGKEEGLGEQISKTKSITDTYEIPVSIIESLKDRTRLQTLEEVEKKINEMPVDIEMPINYILQTIKEMKK
jgi:hypothetical protein